MNHPPLPPALPLDAHKGTAGRVLSLAGSASMPGATLLAARAAQRAGAGLVAVGCLDSALLTLVPSVAPEAVLVDLTEALELSGRVRGGAAERLLARQPHAVLIGPGLGRDERTRALLALTLATLEVPMVVDADALNVLAGEPERLRGARAPLVLTPHPLEAERLLGHPVESTATGRETAACELAERAGAIVCLKGHGTLVVEPGGTPWRATSGNPALATAGSGDVLAGILVAYLARVRSLKDARWTPLAAARAAVHVHGVAGDLARARLGELAVIASDLIHELPAAQQRAGSTG